MDLGNSIAGLLATAQPQTTDQINQNTQQGQTIQQNALNLQLQQQQRQAQIQQLVKAQQAKQAYINNPNAQTLQGIAVNAPEIIKGVQDAYNSLDSEAKDQHLNDASSTLGYIQSGNYGAASNLIQSRIDADHTAGKDTTDDTQFQQVLNKAAAGDTDAQKQVFGLAQLHVASILGKDKFAEAYPALAKLPTEIANTAAQTTELGAKTASELANADQANRGTLKENSLTGDLYNDNPNAVQPIEADTSATGSSIAQGYQAVAGTETSATGGSAQKNPNSSALGNSQAISSTWLNTVKQNFPELAKGKSDTAILAMRIDPKISAQVGQEIYKQGAYNLKAQGLPVNQTTAAIAYKLGPTDGANVIKAAQTNPDQSLATILPAKVIAANPQLRPNGKVMSAGQYVQSIGTKIPPNALTLGDSNSQGKDFLDTLPKGKADLITSIVQGASPAPLGRSGQIEANSPIYKQILQADPTYTPARYKLVQDLGDPESKVGGVINANNTMLAHLSEFLELAHQRNAKSGKFGNQLGNVASFLGGATLGPGSGLGTTANLEHNMKSLQKQISDEKAKGLNIDDAGGRDAFNADLDPTQPFNYLVQQAQTIRDAALAKLSTTSQQFQQAAKIPADPNKIILPQTQTALTKMNAFLTRDPNHNEILVLQKNPTPANVAYFDKTFGAGSSHKILGGG